MPWLWLSLLIGPPLTDAPAPTPPPPAVAFKLIRPDEQLDRFLKWFDGSKAGFPARALADWKRAKPGRGFTKAAEAGFAVLNPEMVRELRTLDGLCFEGRVGPDGSFEWAAAIPGDDGTFDALATAMTLTDGATQGAFDRIGPAGAPFMTKGKDGRGVLLGSSPESLQRLAKAAPFAPTSLSEPRSGLLARLDARALAGLEPVRAKMAAEALLGAGMPTIEAASALQGETWKLTIAGRCDGSLALAPAKIPPEWLSEAPQADLLAAFAFAIEPSPEFWNKTFAWADRIEHADPARAKVAPLRLRLALLSGGAGLKPEVDLFPHLLGLSGFLVEGKGDAPRRAVLTLHFKDESKARMFVEKTGPAVGQTLQLGEMTRTPDGAVTWKKGNVASPWTLQAVKSDVRIGWGPNILADASVGPRTRFEETDCQRFMYLVPAALAPDLSGAGRLTWRGEFQDGASTDTIVVEGMKDLVVRVLSRLLDEGVR